MQVILDLKNKKCKVIRETGDKRISSSGYNGTVESVLLHKVKIELIEQGYDVIKKRISSDPGNMVDDYQQWIRTRKWDSQVDPNQFAIYNSQWAIFDAGKVYNEDGEFTFAVL